MPRENAQEFSLSACPADRVITAVCTRLGAATPAELTAESLAAEAQIPVDKLRDLFPTREALLRMVAETASHRKFDFVTKSVTLVPTDHPVAQFVAIQHGMLNWANEYPQDVRLLARREVQDVLNAQKMTSYALCVYDVSERILGRAEEMGQLPAHTSMRGLIIAIRAFTYGLIGLDDDSLFHRWQNAVPLPDTVHALLDEFAALYLPSYASYLKEREALSADNL